MHDDEAFLRAIGAAPADDAPRLVYADWLEERGDAARAEFIRVQCELARPGGERGRRTELRLRERELLQTHGHAWASPFRPACDNWEFRRGFVEVIAGSADKLERLPSHLFAAGVVQEVRVTGPVRSSRTISGMTHMDSIRVLRLSSLALTDIDLWPLREAKQFAQLDVMDLRWNDLTPDRIQQAIANDLIPPGGTLMLGGNHFGADCRVELSEALGDRVSFAVERSADHLYAVPPRYDRMTGIDADGRQVVLGRSGLSRARLLAFYFDLDGQLIGVDESPLSARRRDAIVDDPIARNFAARVGLVLGRIAVRRFYDHDTAFGITDFTDAQRDLIDNPPDSPDDPTQPARCDQYRRLKYDWVPRGDFVFGDLPY
jgi:uncharacterized protein (TIGR02996 family)